MIERYPYASQRMPVFARNVVATSQPLAAQAGLGMLQRGGSAVDAAVAAAAVLTVVQPTGNGLGSDAFAMVWDGAELHGLNGSGRSPGRLDPSRFAGRDAMPTSGWDAVTVPGAVSAWVALHERFGRLPLGTVLAPAIAYARDGFLVSPITAALWSRARATHGQRADFAAAFLPDGRSPAAGSMWRFPEQARTLEAIAVSRGERFYRGDVARAIADHARREGSVLDERDLAEHAPSWVEPIALTVDLPDGPLTLHELPPNGQGIAALVALGLLDHTPIRDCAPDDADAAHLQIEAIKQAFDVVHRHVADPDHLERSSTSLLDPRALRERAARIDPERASVPAQRWPGSGGTVYLAAADAGGMMVSFIQSNYMGFGSGVVVPGTGISLQNRAAGFVLDPTHPNRVGPGKRPFHTIMPGFVTRLGCPTMAFGMTGGPMQPQGHVQLVLRTALWGQNAQAACDAPRWQVRDGVGVDVERGFAPDVVAELRRRGHDVRVSDTTFGGAQVVACLHGGYIAASDPRNDGQAVGF